MADLKRIPAILYVGAGLGGVLGAILGRAACLGYDFFHQPMFPTVGANLNPAGWMGWWLAGGALAGAAVGLVLASMPLGLVALWQSIFRRKG
jgi:hypothetical protein